MGGLGVSCTETGLHGITAAGKKEAQDPDASGALRLD
jgi:hypothetical protein